MSYIIEQIPLNSSQKEIFFTRELTHSTFFKSIYQLFNELSIVENNQKSEIPSQSLRIATQLAIQINGIVTHLSHIVNLNLQSNPHHIHIILIPSINHLPINILSIIHQNILNSYLLKVNSKLKFGSISINPLSGYLKFRVFTLLGQQFTSKLYNQIEKKDLQKTIKQLVLHAKSIFQHHLPKILHLVNFQKVIQSQKSKGNNTIFHPKYIQQLQTLEKLSSITHVQFNYAIKFKFAIKSNTRKQINSQLLKLILKYQNTKVQGPLKEMDQSKLIQIHSIVTQKIDTQTKNSRVMQTIRKIDEKSIRIIKKIASGGSSDVYLIQGSFKDEQISKNNRKLFVKKVSKSETGVKKLQHQKKISSVFICEIGKYEIIPQCFEIDQNNPSKQKNYQLYMEFFPMGTLSSFLSKRITFFGISTKIHYVLKLIKTLYHFNYHKVEHMDLKPQNIIIDNKWNVKLIDFGQSYFESIVKEADEYKVGVSIPYSAPELFSKISNNSVYRCDIFSLGVIMFEIFFGFLPFDYERSEILINEMKQRKYYQNMHFCVQKIIKGMQQRIGILLIRLCMKCINPNGKLRPSLDWIRLYLIKISLLFQNY